MADGHSQCASLPVNHWVDLPQPVEAENDIRLHSDNNERHTEPSNLAGVRVDQLQFDTSELIMHRLHTGTGKSDVKALDG
jgi:hypothetical protein